MKKPFKLSFDGCGLNLVSEEFSPRFATIQSNFRNAENAADTRELGHILEAAPELLKALRFLVSEARASGIIEQEPCMIQAREAIAKATRKL